ncbi:N-formylglutamate amidohydrolase [candidate division FCPU426 bacterium]|nr:N-formylglutamate amidohydrolase [candidate division FCPU426 bacterium]
MLLKKIPLCLTLPEAGENIPPGWMDAVPGTTFPEQQALARIFDISGRLEFFIKADMPPAWLKVDAPRREAVPDTMPGQKRALHALGRTLLAQYYAPYHARIKKAVASPKMRVGLDCHCFVSRPWPREEGRPLQPIICLGNNGDFMGESRSGAGGTTCPPDMIRDLRDLMAARFADERGQVLLNTPVTGGYTIKKYATRKKPWIRMDIARHMLVSADGQINHKRLAAWRDKMESIAVLFCKLQGWM